MLDAVQRASPLAEAVGCTLAQLALAWCLRDEVVASVIAGATRPEQIEENAAAADLEVDPHIFHQINRILEPVATYEPYTS